MALRAGGSARWRRDRPPWVILNDGLAAQAGRKCQQNGAALGSRNVEPFGFFTMKQPERWRPVRAAINRFCGALIYGAIKFFRAPAWKSRRNLWAGRLRPMR